MLRPRMSRIYYKGKFLDYPLRALNVLRNIALWEGILIGFSYLWARIHPPKDESNYENWLVKRFGWRLYRTFFKTYTEKVWGVPVSDMPADWAAQRVKNLDLRKAVINAILPKRGQTEITTLIEEFQYPKYGPGMMWEVCADKVQAAGGTIEMGARLTRHQRRGRPGGLGDLRPGRHRAHGPGRPRHLDHADARAGAHHHAAPAARGRGRRRRPALPRLPDRRARRARGAQLPRQLDLHPRHRRRGRADPELRLVVALPGQGRADLPRPRVLRLRGRRHVEQARRRAHRAGDQGADLARPGRRGRRRARLRGARAQGLPVLRLQLQGQRRDDPQVDRDRGAQHPPRRAQRHAQVQQPGPLHVHRHAHGGEHLRRRPRHLVGQRRGGVPRGGVDRTRRPRAAASHRRHARARSTLAEHAPRSRRCGGGRG